MSFVPAVPTYSHVIALDGQLTISHHMGFTAVGALECALGIGRLGFGSSSVGCSVSISGGVSWPPNELAFPEC